MEDGCHVEKVADGSGVGTLGRNAWGLVAVMKKICSINMGIEFTNMIIPN
jgi:hypothetical protein